MKINLKIVGDYLPSANHICSYVNKKLRSTLKNTRQYIDDVVVRITDLNGPKGGVDKMCSIQLHIPGQAPVYVKSQDGSIYSAISKAANRAGHKIRRRVRRRQFLAMGGKLKRFRENSGYKTNPLFAGYENI